MIPIDPIIHHTDRGCHYAAARYQTHLERAGVVASMSRPGDCSDTALVESFFATLNTARVDTQAWPTRRAARQAIVAWIEVFSHRQRLHAALDYCAPVLFEERTVPMADAA
jgi:putative transposase